MPHKATSVWSLILLFTMLSGLRVHADTSYPTVTSNLLSLCNHCQILLLGETHRQPESQALFLNLVKSLLTRGERLLVGLEITAGKQDALDAVMEGRRTPEGLAPSMIDSPSYQSMLTALAQFHLAQRSRLTVVAIDDLESDRPRDEAMATNLQTHLATGHYDRAVVLMGNLHTIQTMRWADDAWSKKPFLAERLLHASFRVTSVMQDLDATCAHRRQPTFYRMTDTQGLEAVRRRAEIVKVHPEMNMSTAVDGVVVWACQA